MMFNDLLCSGELTSRKEQYSLLQLKEEVKLKKAVYLSLFNAKRIET